MTVMHQLTQLADDCTASGSAHAEPQRPAERLLALARATRRAERAERRMRRAARQARRLRAQLQAQITPRASDHPAADPSGPQPQRNDHQEVIMNRTRLFRPVRRLAGILAGLAPAVLAAAAAAPAAFALPAPPRWAAETGPCRRPRSAPS